MTFSSRWMMGTRWRFTKNRSVELDLMEESVFSEMAQGDRQ